MFRLLIIGKTEDIAKQAALWAVSEEAKGSFYEKRYEVSGLAISLRVFPLWLDQKARKPAGDGLLLVAKEADDLQAMEAFIECYRNMPMKFVLYDGAPSNPGFEAKWDARPLPKGTSIEFVEKLIAVNNEVVKRVAKVFQSFDTSKTGKIDVDKLDSITRDLATEFGDHIYKATEETALSLQEGLSSLEDIMEWWKSGGRDNPSQIAGVVKKTIEENTLIQGFVKAFRDTKVDSQQQVSEGKFAIHGNKVEAPGVSLNFNFKTCGNGLNADYQEFGASPGAGYYDPFLTIAFHSPNPPAALAELQELINTFLIMGKSFFPEINAFLEFIDIKYSTSANKVLLCIVPSEKGGNVIEPINSILNSVSHAFFPDQTANSSLSFATDLDKFNSDERPILDVALDGISINVDCKINKALYKYLLQVRDAIAELKIFPSFLLDASAVALLIDSLISSVEGELEFEVSQEVKETLIELADDDDLKSSFKSLKEEEAERIKEKIQSIPLANSVYEFFRDHVVGFDIFAYAIGLVGVKTTITLPGLSSLLTL